MTIRLADPPRGPGSSRIGPAPQRFAAIQSCSSFIDTERDLIRRAAGLDGRATVRAAKLSGRFTQAAVRPPAPLSTRLTARLPGT